MKSCAGLYAARVVQEVKELEYLQVFGGVEAGDFSMLFCLLVVCLQGESVRAHAFVESSLECIHIL